MDTPCAHCGQPMTARTRRTARFCSSDCRLTYHYSRSKAALIASRQPKPCKGCGAPLGPELDGNRRFCSLPCMRRFHLAQEQARRRAKSATRRAERGPCRRCGQPIPLDRRGNAVFCSRACYRNETNKRVLAAAPTAHRRRRYGLTPGAFEALWAAQGSRCAICRGTTSNGRGFHIDHDHATGAVRGILCNSCNQGLGRFRDEPALLRAAADYVEAPMR